MQTQGTPQADRRLQLLYKLLEGPQVLSQTEVGLSQVLV